MKPVDRQKMCSNCDGRIPYEATQCPYCFTQQEADSNSSKSFSSSDPISALYSPPYPSRTHEMNPAKTAIMSENTEGSSLEAESIPFWSILMLTLGGNLLALGLLQFFFSDHGVLRLEINSSYWFLMVIVAAPLIYFGLKNLSSKK